jgi:hypothetical protein
VVFETLYEAVQRNELILIDGGFCHWHLRRDGQLTIYEIISIKLGAGSKILEILKNVNEANNIFAKCPEDLEANKWYEKRGFQYEGEETTSSGRKLKLWRYLL